MAFEPSRILIMSGTLALNSGQNVRRLQEVERMLYLVTGSDGRPCYTLEDDLGGNYDKVFRCWGDRGITSSLGSYYDGTCRWFLRMASSSATQANILVYGEWSATQGAGNQGATTSMLWQLDNSSGSVNYWFFGTPESVEVLQEQTTRTEHLLAGQPLQQSVSKANRGIAFSSGPINSGTNVSINIDRDMRDGYSNWWGGFAVSGTVHMYPVTPSGSALYTPTSGNICTIVSVGPSSIVVDRVVNSLTGNVIIGEMCRRIVRDTDYLGASSTNWSAASASTTAITISSDNHDSWAAVSGEDGFPWTTRIIWGKPVSLYAAGGGQEAVYGWWPAVRVALSGTSFFTQGDLFYDTWKGNYYEIFANFPAIEGGTSMYPYTGSVVGRTIWPGKMRNYFSLVEDDSRRTQGTVNPPNGGRVRELWLNDFDFPSGSMVSTPANCNSYAIDNLVYNNQYIITQLSSGIRQTFLDEGCQIEQAPFSLFIRGSTRSLRGRSDPYVCVRDTIQSTTGSFFPLSRG